MSAIALASGLTISAMAVQYNQSVNLNGPPPSNGNDQGIYYGIGNGNGGWTVDTQNNLELGLRAHVRYPEPLNVFNLTDNNQYNFTDGNSISPASRASWNVDFSINTQMSGLGNDLLSSYAFTLAMDKDPSLGQDWVYVDPLLIPDNAPSGSTTIAQNSQNVGFFPLLFPYGKTIPGTYDFTLSAYDVTGAFVASTSIRVNVNGGGSAVPEVASTGALALLGLIPVLGWRRALRAWPAAK